MTATLLRQQITKVINDVEDKDFLEAVYTIVSTKADEVDFELTSEMKRELDIRKEKHEKGISKSYSWASVKKAALKTK